MGEQVLIEPGLRIERDVHGVPGIAASDEARLYRGLGFCHAHDRGLQMLLMRILGQGRLSEQLDGSPDGLKIDLFFRRMNWVGSSASAVETFRPEARALVDAYCEGVNKAFGERVPWELRLVGYRHEPWRAEDSILLARMVGYLTLAQSQGEIERLIVEMVQRGVGRARLEELFPGRLDSLDEDLLKSVTLGERIVPADLRWGGGARLMASNNWVVSGKKTSSGMPIVSNDPHLEGNRLPAAWCEVTMSSRDRWGIGATLPGLPALIVGRTGDLAWGATYAFGDAEDSWVEDCRDGAFRREGEWIPFRQRRETIRRKKAASHEVTFFENDHGVLDGDPRVAGRYLATRWAAAECGVRSVQAFQAMWNARTVEEGRRHLGGVELSFNWVLADRHGDIAYQMSDLAPRRREGVSGLVPVPGWEARNDWLGFHESTDLPRLLNPECGCIVTANDDLNHHGRATPITVSMGSYRADRIADLLRDRHDLTVQDMGRIQCDLYSLQAERFMKLFEPLLPNTEAADVLRKWDRRYDSASKGAALFEKVYLALRRAVFGPRVVDHLLDRTGLFSDFYAAFDRVLLAETSAWFDGSRDDIYRSVLAETLDRPADELWGASRQVTLSHMLFGSTVPRFFGFDRGPITLQGGRATPHQGQIYRSGGRTTTFMPSYRMVTDMARPEVHTSIVGGPSDRRFSPYYCSDLVRWLAGEFKLLRPPAFGPTSPERP
jgi:penicillin amidase